MLKATVKWFTLLLISTLLFPIAAQPALADSLDTSEQHIQLVINGQLYTQPDGEPAPYINTQNRTMVPVSLLVKAMNLPGASIEWDEPARTVTVRYTTHTIVFTHGAASVDINNHTVVLDSAAEIRQGRLFAPVRALVGALGGSLQWESARGLIYIATEPSTAAPPTGSEADALIGQQATATLEALAEQDWGALAELVHPDRGVRFSPYTDVDPVEQTRLLPEELLDAAERSKLRQWGYYDGTGDPIELSIQDYLLQFVYPHDYRTAPERSYNRQLFHGNVANNASWVYPGAIIAEYHFDGIDPQYGGLDWRSLRLVFQPLHGQWYLVGVINDQWTS